MAVAVVFRGILCQCQPPICDERSDLQKTAPGAASGALEPWTSVDHISGTCWPTGEDGLWPLRLGCGCCASFFQRPDLGLMKTQKKGCQQNPANTYLLLKDTMHLSGLSQYFLLFGPNLSDIPTSNRCTDCKPRDWTVPSFHRLAA